MTEPYKIIEVKESVFADNDREAARLRTQLKQDRTFLLNLMSSPGSGKTTTLLRTLEALKDELRIGVMEADIDSDVDAKTIADAGVKSIQLHTGGMCHLDASMTEQPFCMTAMQFIQSRSAYFNFVSEWYHIEYLSTQSTIIYN